MSWFHHWFGSPYYNCLYAHRNDAEAHLFIDNLLIHLQLKPNAKITDAGCGKGRHSIYLANKGFDVTGLDITKENIDEANESANEHLRFFIQDIRIHFPTSMQDLVINVFTSFGYFKTESEDLAALQNMYDCLAPNGFFVMDFLNAEWVKSIIIPYHEAEMGGYKFIINKKIEDGFVRKYIRVIDGEKEMDFMEEVKLLSHQKLTEYFATIGFKIQGVYGDYSLNPFDEQKSERLIIIAQK
ncbi:MAG: class I SAM-dependent methyltransferase [Bacteroidetes bacterium]|nr:class I SAM-dependent methyltransferase [Bacteroidota bacterium]